MTVITIYNIILTCIRHVTTNFGYYNIRIQIYILHIVHLSWYTVMYYREGQLTLVLYSTDTSCFL